MGTPNDSLKNIVESAPENPNRETSEKSKLRRVLDYIGRAHPNLYRAAVASYKGTRDALKSPLTPAYERAYGQWNDASLQDLGKKTMSVAISPFVVAHQIGSKIKENYRRS